MDSLRMLDQDLISLVPLSTLWSQPRYGFWSGVSPLLLPTRRLLKFLTLLSYLWPSLWELHSSSATETRTFPLQREKEHIFKFQADRSSPTKTTAVQPANSFWAQTAHTASEHPQLRSVAFLSILSETPSFSVCSSTVWYISACFLRPSWMLQGHNLQRICTKPTTL